MRVWHRPPGVFGMLNRMEPLSALYPLSALIFVMICLYKVTKIAIYWPDVGVYLCEPILTFYVRLQVSRPSLLIDLVGFGLYNLASLLKFSVSDSNIFYKEYMKAKEAYANLTCSGYKCYLQVIKSDLKPFASGIDLNVFESAPKRGVKYLVLNHRIYRQNDCLFPSRCEGVDYFLSSIRESLNDTQFVVNFHDWPQISKHFNKPVPVFSFSKTDEYYDIMYPAWSFWKGGPALKIYPRGIGRWDQFYKTLVKEADAWPWPKKINSGFFIGSRTSSERDSLILLSRAHPDLVVAKYTKNQAWKSDKDTLNQPPADEVPLEDHCRYRYLFNFRGVAASFRFKFLFLCKSVVIHVGSEWKEFFYDGLKPWYHYIPIDNNSSIEDYKILLEFLKNEDTLAQEIAERGYDFVHNNLRMKDVENYWRRLLKEYTKLLKFVPAMDESLIDVTKV